MCDLQLALEPLRVAQAPLDEARRVHERARSEQQEEDRVGRVAAPVSRIVGPREEPLLQEAERDRRQSRHEEQRANQTSDVRAREAQDSTREYTVEYVLYVWYFGYEKQYSCGD